MSDALSQVSSNPGLRKFIFVFSILATLLLLIILTIASGQLSSNEQLSRNLSWALIFIYGVPFFACVLPAVLLAAFNRWLPLAATLCALSIPFLILIFRAA